jgi:hypothetical protein
MISMPSETENADNDNETSGQRVLRIESDLHWKQQELTRLENDDTVGHTPGDKFFQKQHKLRDDIHRLRAELKVELDAT